MGNSKGDRGENMDDLIGENGEGMGCWKIKGVRCRGEVKLGRWVVVIVEWLF